VIGGRTACEAIRAYLREKTDGELIWVYLLVSIRPANPEERNKQRRWRRLVNEERGRRDADAG
jgi:hypothetical protein